MKEGVTVTPLTEAYFSSSLAELFTYSVWMEGFEKHIHTSDML